MPLKYCDVLWRNIIMEKKATNDGGEWLILGSLLQSSEAVVNKMVSDGLVDHFKALVSTSGPVLRLSRLCCSICNLKGKPSRVNQEMCARKLWLFAADRYQYCVVFHELDRTVKVGYNWALN